MTSGKTKWLCWAVVARPSFPIEPGRKTPARPVAWLDQARRGGDGRDGSGAKGPVGPFGTPLGCGRCRVSRCLFAVSSLSGPRGQHDEQKQSHAS